MCSSGGDGGDDEDDDDDNAYLNENPIIFSLFVFNILTFLNYLFLFIVS